MAEEILSNNLIDSLLNPLVETDKADYAPGETVKITATGFEKGSTVEFSIEDDPNDSGDDGDLDVYAPFIVTDGGIGDLDGIVNGEIVATWLVPTDNNGTGSGTPDALNATLNLTATGDGADSVFGTNDDQIAIATFTDSGGDFANTDFAAAAPFTYDHATGGGAYNDRTVGDFNDITEQLEGGEFALGDIVTYLAQITMEGTTVNTVQTAEFDFRFLANSTGQAGAAHADIVNVAVNYGKVENGDDGTGSNPGEGFFGLDSGISDDGGSTATLVSESLTGPLFQSGSELLGTVRVNDLEAGEKVVIRIDVLLAGDPGSNPTGNLQGQLDAGRVVWTAEGTNIGDTINTGQQTIPFLKIGELEGAGDPLIDIQKTVTTQGDTFDSSVEELTVTSGDTVRYYYEVSNDGTANLFDLNWTDDAGTPGNTTDDFTLADATILKVVDFDGNEFTSGFGNLYGDLDSQGDALDLASGATVIFYNEVQLSTQGTVVNTADAIGNNGKSGGNFAELTDSDTATVNVEGTPAISLTKIADVSSVNAANQIITYTYTVSNDGNIPLTGITLSDDNFTPDNTGDDFTPTFNSSSDDGNGILDVGESWTYTANYTVTQANIDDGSDLINVATADSNETNPVNDPETVDVVQNPNFTIVKEADVDLVDAAGEVVNYSYTVTNTGNQSLTNVTLSDDNFTPGDTNDDFIPTFDASSDNGNEVLDVGESWTYTANYTVTQANVDSGADLVNVAIADTDQTDPKHDNETVDVVQNPNLSIVKNADVQSVEAVGDVINYSYTVTNTGNQSLTNVTVSDDNFTPGDTSDDFNPTFDASSDDGNGILDVGESWTYNASYTVTQADVDSGADLVNVATADTDQTDPKTDDAVVDVLQDADFLLTKDADVSEVNAVGDIINYTYTLKNTGTVSLTNISLSDDNFTPGDTSDDFVPTLTNNGNGDSTLDVGETWTYAASYTVTQADIDSGEALINLATGNTDQTEPKTDNETVTVNQNPNFTVVKEADVTQVSAVGDVINYTYTIANTGNQTLTNVALSDDSFTPGDTSDDFNPTLDASSDNGNGVLDVGESWTYNASHTVTQDDLDNGADLVNVATADTEQTEPKTDDAVVDVIQTPNLSISKIANVSEVDEAGKQIVYAYTVQNTGNITLENITVTDDNFTPSNTGDDFAIALDKTSLAPGETATGTYTYTITQADIDNGADLINIATANSNQTNPKEDSETVDIIQNPSLSILKEADVGVVNAAGQVIAYTYTVTNTGNQSLTNVTVSDDNFTPGDTSDDFNPTFDVGSDNGNGVLDVGESWIYNSNYTVTQDEIDSGAALVNVATANSDQTEPETDNENVGILQDPNLSISKEADVSEVNAAGDVVNYSYTVTNTGNVTLENITLRDDNFTPGDTSDDFNPTFNTSSDNGNGVLDVGESWTYNASHTVTQDEIDSGADLVNIATADSNRTEPITDDEIVNVVQNPNLSILKEANVSEVNGAGEQIVYAYTVQNTGNVTLENISVIDDNFTSSNTEDDFAIALDKTSLAPGNTATGTYTYTVTQADIDSGADLINVAIANSDQTDPKEEDEKVTVNQNPNLAVTKTADVTEVSAAGNIINYSYLVTNTGNQTLTNITLSDDNFTPGDTSDDFAPTFDSSSDNGNGILDVGETWTYTSSYTVTQTDIDSGEDLVNVVTAQSDQTQPKTDDEKVDVLQDADFLLLKTADVNEVNTAGEIITYLYTIENTGNQTLTNVSLGDDNFTPNNTSDDFTPTFDLSSDNGNGVLDVGEIWIYTASYTVTQADIDSGADLVNVATGDTDQTDSKADNEIVTINQNPNLSILKEADVSEVQNVGDVINYTYTVENTGNVTLENVSITDDNFTPDDGDITNGDETDDDFVIALSQTTLAPGETATGTFSYTVTQADFDSGLDLVNVATAKSDQTDPKIDDETVDVVQNPSITLDKVTSDGVVTGDNIGVSAGSSIKWIYTVSNDGNLNLSNISLSDDEQGAITNLIDNGDGDAVLAPGEFWIYEASGTAISGLYDNIGTVTADHSGGQGQVEATDESSYTGIEGSGARTPGFWKNWTEVWDGDASNDSRFAGRDGFPSGDILLSPYSASSEAPRVLDPVSEEYTVGILIGDYNRNGITDNGESTIFYSLKEAQAIVGANNKIQKNDKRWTLDRSLIASWLNYTAFNPAPTDDIDNAIAWVQEHTPDENGDGIGDGNLILGASEYAVPASSDFWNSQNPIVPNGGELINTALDRYNNTGVF